MDDATLKDIAAENWYYQLELKGGHITNGRPRPPSELFRRHLRNVALDGTHCLDIGTQEFLAPVLMLRQGAASVTAYDRLALPTRYEAVRHSYEVDFDYVHSLALGELRQALIDGGRRAVFDVVNFSGVLYHMVDPLPGLAMARSFLRTGGLLILETSVKRSADFILEFNAKGTMYTGSNYFQVSIATLDYWLRMLRLQPIDCSWHGRADVGRMATVCRAVDEPVAEPDDDWMRKGFVRADFKPFGLDYRSLRSRAEPVGYTPLDATVAVPREGTEAIDLFASVSASPPAGLSDDMGVLRLADRS
jgi:SAM-dependent methyltransferase